MATLLGIENAKGRGELDQAGYEKAVKSTSETLDLGFYSVGDK